MDDVFICHAGEDKEAAARPLANALETRGIAVWIDDSRITIGDQLRRKIDEGLRAARFGVVILSPSFFAKQWPQWELDGLVDREITSKSKVILPVWHEIDHHGVAAYSPSLADKHAARTRDGIDAVAAAIADALDVVEAPGTHPASRTDEPSLISCYGQVESTNDVFTPNGRVFQDNFCVWLYVRNDAASAEFSVRYWNIIGVPTEWGPYAVRHTAWEGSTSTRPEIDGYGGERRVRVANVARKPRALWFWTFHNGALECDNQYLIDERIGPNDPVSVNFHIEIVNHSTAAKLNKRGYLSTVGQFDPFFILADAPPR